MNQEGKPGEKRAGRNRGFTQIHAARGREIEKVLRYGFSWKDRGREFPAVPFTTSGPVKNDGRKLGDS
jgi:hypothetical protein